MAIIPAKVIGELKTGYISLALWPGRYDNVSPDGKPSEQTQAIEIDCFPEKLRTINTEVWLATEKINSKDNCIVYEHRIYPRAGEDPPKEYAEWLTMLSNKNA